MPDLPQLLEERCNGCGDCLRICPTDCLELAGLFPWLVRPGDCVSCALCVQICPTEALTLAPPEVD
jgi:hypothetical protein